MSRENEAMATTVHDRGKLVSVSVWDSHQQRAVTIATEHLRQLRDEIDFIIKKEKL